MIGDVAALLNTRRRQLGIPMLRPGLVIGIDADLRGKVTMLLVDGAGHPAAVAKVARTGASEHALVAEYSALGDLQALVGGSEPSLPRPLLFERVRNHAVLVTSTVPGVPLSVGYYRRGHVRSAERVGADFAAAGDWLARFHQVAGVSTVPLAEAWQSHLAPLFARYRHVVGRSEWETRLVDRLRLEADDLGDLAVPLGFVHGDYCIGNVLLDRGAVTGVVDWELGRARGPVLTDVYKFAASYGSFLDRADPPRSGRLPGHPGWADVRAGWGDRSSWPNLVNFLYAFTGVGWFPGIVRDYLDAQYRRLGCSPALEPLLLTAFVAEQALALDNPVYREGYRRLLRVLDELATTRPAVRPAVA